jgi:hypothetical protein
MSAKSASKRRRFFMSENLIENLTGNVLENILEKIKRLPGQTEESLKDVRKRPLILTKKLQ